MGNLLFPTGEPPSARAVLVRTAEINKLLKADPDNDALLYELGTLKLHGSPSDPQQAAKLAKAAMEIDPNQMDYYCLLIVASCKAEDYSTAIDIHTAMVELAGEDPETHCRNVNFELACCLVSKLAVRPDYIVSSLESALEKDLFPQFDERNYAIDFLLEALEESWKPEDYDGGTLAPLNDEQVELAKRAMAVIKRLEPFGETEERCQRIAEIVSQC